MLSRGRWVWGEDAKGPDCSQDRKKDAVGPPFSTRSVQGKIMNDAYVQSRYILKTILLPVSRGVKCLEWSAPHAARGHQESRPGRDRRSTLLIHPTPGLDTQGQGCRVLALELHLSHFLSREYQLNLNKPKLCIMLPIHHRG